MDRALKEILIFLKKQRKMDFTGYKETTLARRVAKRLFARKVSSYEEYLKMLEKDPHEPDELIADILINVTRFFRDREAFDTINRKVIPPILSRNDAQEKKHIRVWCPGCSTGEEAYSIGILLLEKMRETGIKYPLSIYGTDTDIEAIKYARKGNYKADRVQEIDPGILKTYFDFNGETGTYKICDEIRDIIKFGIQDLVSDPPISRLDILMCRNVLIYFSKELQKEVFPHFYYALNKGGFLILGKAENPVGKVNSLFKTVDKKWKIFRK